MAYYGNADKVANLEYDSANAAQRVSVIGGAQGVNTPYRVNLTGLTTLIASLATQISGYNLINLNTQPIYIDIFDTVAAVTLGVTVPTATIPMCANATPANGSGVALANFVQKITSGKVQIAAVTVSGGATPASTPIVGTIWAK